MVPVPVLEVPVPELVLLELVCELEVVLLELVCELLELELVDFVDLLPLLVPPDCEDFVDFVDFVAPVGLEDVLGWVEPDVLVPVGFEELEPVGFEELEPVEEDPLVLVFEELEPVEVALVVHLVHVLHSPVVQTGNPSSPFDLSTASAHSALSLALKRSLTFDGHPGVLTRLELNCQSP